MVSEREISLDPEQLEGPVQTEGWLMNQAVVARELGKLIGQEVWIKRSNGDWQRVEVTNVTSNNFVGVSWDNSDKPGYRLSKNIVGQKLLEWQREHQA